MSDVLMKLLMGFLILVIIVSAITAVREDLLAGGTAYDMFVAAFDCFPFAKEMSELAGNIGKFGVTLQGLSPSNLLDDLTKIFAMTVVCPIAVSIASFFFLKVPNYEDWYEREKYMNRFSYRVKEAVLNVIMMPICAMITAVLVHKLQIWVQAELTFLHPNLISLVVLVAMFTASVLVRYVDSPAFMGLTVRHRLIVDLLGGVLKIVGMNLLSFLIALALLNDQGNVALGYIVTMFIYLAGLDLMLQSITGLFS